MVKLQRQGVIDMIFMILIKVGVMAQSVCFCVLYGFHTFCAPFLREMNETIEFEFKFIQIDFD